MSVRTTFARPRGTALGGALLGVLRLLVTLALFVVTMLAFVLTPVLLLVAAFLAWAVLRPRPDQLSSRPGTPGHQGPETASHAFGAGA